MGKDQLASGSAVPHPERLGKSAIDCRQRPDPISFLGGGEDGVRGLVGFEGGKGSECGFVGDPNGGLAAGGKDVKLIGMGTATTSKTGKKTSIIKTVTSFEETIDSAVAPVAVPEAK